MIANAENESVAIEEQLRLHTRTGRQTKQKGKNRNKPIMKE